MSVQLQPNVMNPVLSIGMKLKYMPKIKRIRALLDTNDVVSLKEFIDGIRKDLHRDDASVNQVAEILSVMMVAVTTTSQAVYSDISALYYGEQAWIHIITHHAVSAAFRIAEKALSDVMQRDASGRMPDDTFSKSISEKIKLLIEQRFSELLGIAELAQAVYLSPNYLSRVFKRETGRTVTDYLIEVRIDRAKTLLRSELSLKTYEVGELVGYPDPVYFTKLFKKIVGVTPKSYRLRR